MNTIKDDDVLLSLNETEGEMGGRNEFFIYVKKETVGETYKHLNKIIKDKSIYKLVDVNEVVSANEDLTLFEDSLRLIIIDSLRLENKIVEILLNQDFHQIKRILKCDWFFQSSLSAETYCRAIFPNVSLSLRYKLLKKLSRNLTNETEAEKLFEYIHHTYSSKQAEVLLPKCSSKFILKYVSEVKLWSQQVYKNLRILLNISKRHPEVGLQILSIVFDETKIFTSVLTQFKKVLMFFASHHPNLFTPFYKKHLEFLYFLKFGKKMTRRYGLEIKEILLTSDTFLTMNNFNRKTLFKAFSFSDKVKFMVAKVTFCNTSLTINNWALTPYTTEYFPSLVRPDVRMLLIETVFKQLYNMNYYDHPKFWRSEVLQLIPLQQRLPYVEKYEKWVKSPEDYDEGYYPKPKKPESYVYLYNFDVAFVKLKKILSKAGSARRRRSVLTYMVKTCSVNKDSKGLEELVEYVYERHRNDETGLLALFLQNICSSFTSSELTPKTSEKIEELAYYCAFRGHFSNYQEIMEKCLYNRLEEGKDVGTQVQRVFEVVFLTRQNPSKFLLDFTSKHSRDLFYKYYEFIINWGVANPEKKKTKEILHLSVWKTLVKFNTLNKKNPILVSDLKEFVLEIEKIIKAKNDEMELGDVFVDLLQKYHPEVLTSEFKIIFYTHALKQNPDWFVGRWNEVLEYLFSNYGNREVNFVLDFLKFMSFLGKTTELKDAILKEFQNESSELGRRINGLKMYSQIANWEEFEKAIEIYKPKSEKIDLKTDRNFVKIQLTIPKAMLNVRPSWKCLPQMMNFFTGDFLKSVMPSFYSCCYTTRVDLVLRILKGYLDDIEHDKRISIRKDVIRIIVNISTRQELLIFCSKCWDEINHYSIRSILFKLVSKCFLEVPNPETFKIVGKFIEESDILVIRSKPDISRVPDLFLNDYITALWRYSEKEKADFRNTILRYFNHNNIRFLSDEFCQNVIKDNLFESNSPLDVNDFAINYLISDPETLDRKTDILLGCFKNNLKKKRKAISVFFSELRIKFFNDSSIFTNVFDALLKKWPDIPPGVFYEDRIMLNYCNIYHNVIKKYKFCINEEKQMYFVSVEFGREVRKFYSTINELRDVVVIVAESLRKFFHETGRYVPNLSVAHAMKELVTDSTDRSLALIAIWTLPVSSVELYSDEDVVYSSKKETIVQFVELLKSYQDDIVDIYLRRRFQIRMEV